MAGSTIAPGGFHAVIFLAGRSGCTYQILCEQTAKTRMSLIRQRFVPPLTRILILGRPAGWGRSID
jgi:hypothetical protein